MRLLLLGCTGFIGRALVPLLLERGHSCSVVSRRSGSLAGLEHSGLQRLVADPALAASWQRPELGEALAAAEGVVNLAGEPIAEKRWTAEQVRLLFDSRLQPTRLLVEAMAALQSGPAVLVSGSAVGYYGSSLERRFSEASPAADDVLGRLCSQWEAAADGAAAFARVVKLRIGIVLGADGGALGKMLPVFRAGLGGPIGSGGQWMSWIHRDDLCSLIAQALEDPGYRGVYNAVAPKPVSMAGFAAALGRVLGRPSLLPVPGPMLQLLLGDGAQVVLQGQEVVPQRLLDQGFNFRYPELAAALAAATSPARR
ncbi:TIGR01777 family oxidoreductase [Synechococcus sp. CS-1324]|uniref:TIGR01777 family oxidoreductase n=1 Tax=unclassified Synechococcus TaxID=2626047 RepID=UPI000DB42B2A|nr:MULTISPECIES: TIGR01777 family oxidoreductase [unclassified Synechococcus]MCT0212171.1 TIGR01777 family oxidoreductase [Synechococcus sp. CS-1326]MCT0230436.1 TIGR01777 family oxidoreductase [Synechococcus sp. CS-1324]MCT0233368.1 TIGR01777 family oxidoreductase [Synechococcus sp. CS-1327]PZV03302.1 MAG: TIGR01777 family protein [Cyanobium sp.]